MSASVEQHPETKRVRLQLWSATGPETRDFHIKGAIAMTEHGIAFSYSLKELLTQGSPKGASLVAVVYRKLNKIRIKAVKIKTNKATERYW